mmetsp:Transcript_29675/g.47800  ORF Transcript_29675/g.47800 Transcript_29675/m.47800 type:complete len:565 (-) Transcript_29675:65-1759(-)
MKQVGAGMQPVPACLQLRLAWLLPLVYGAYSSDVMHIKGMVAVDEEPEAANADLTVVRHTNRFRSFGKPTYPDENPDLTWADLSGHSRGQLGHLCEPGARGQCGDELVCRWGVCRHCSSDAECPILHQCLKAMNGDNSCIREGKKAWEEVFSDPWHFLCTLLIFFSSVLAAAAGTGGGGIFVPVLVLFASLKAESAVPLSQCMIFFSSSCNLVAFVAQRHTVQTSQPKIDYDCIVVFEPMLVLGVTFGVLFHRMSPQWFLLTLLCITLVMALWRTAAKGLKQRAAENSTSPEKLVEAASPISPRISEQRSYFSEIAELTNPKSAQLLGIFCVWLLMFISSFHGLSPCSWQFGAYFAALAILFALSTFIGIRFIITRPEKTPKAMDWTSSSPKEALWFPTVAFCGGFLGGLLGLGGGVIMSPVLLEVGMHSESVQATTAVIVFISSSLATIQFAVLRKIIWHYALWYSLVTIVATFLGQHLCEVYVRRTGRYSLITLSIAGVLLFSLIGLAVVGTIKVMEDITYGQQLWFSTARMCSGGGGLGILDVDVTSAQVWPRDMPGEGFE